MPSRTRTRAGQGGRQRAGAKDGPVLDGRSLAGAQDAEGHRVAGAALEVGVSQRGGRVADRPSVHGDDEVPRPQSRGFGGRPRPHLRHPDPARGRFVRRVRLDSNRGDPYAHFSQGSTACLNGIPATAALDEGPLEPPRSRCSSRQPDAPCPARWRGRRFATDARGLDTPAARMSRPNRYRGAPAKRLVLSTAADEAGDADSAARERTALPATGTSRSLLFADLR